MGACGTTSSTTVRFKLVWHESEVSRTRDYLNEYFERTVDWSNSVADMGLVYTPGQPYTRLIVDGDFYVETGWRMDHFALDCSGKVILVAVDDDGNLSYHRLES